MKKLSLQLFKYGIVGLINTLIFSLTAYLLSLRFNYIIYTTVAYITAMIFSFYLNKAFTFSSKEKVGGEIIKFFGINFSLLAIIQFIQILLIESAKWEEIYAVVFCMILYTGTGFFINKIVVFKS